MTRRLLILCMGLWVIASPVPALSEKPLVVAGSATFQNSGLNRTITTSDRAIINWRQFTVPQDTVTRFVQPSAASAVLNRVIGSDISRIDGTLQANGRVYLINPNGILVGPGGRINTHSFIASTLDLSNAAFMAGRDLNFRGDSSAAITNLGEIEAIGGNVFLIARHVENRGLLRAPKGQVALAAGNDVLLTHDKRVYIRPSGSLNEGTGVLNAGTIQSASIELKAHGNIYALAIRNDGIIRATGTVKCGGRVILSARSGSVVNTGILQATSVTDDGRTKGGEVQVLGSDIRLIGQTVVDASGNLGGGTVNIGGSFQGNGPLPNAEYVLIGPDVAIQADAIKQGSGGQVVIWADQVTGFAGRVSARGGNLGGDGGFVEISGRNGLLFVGHVDTRAPTGINGRLLLDPTTINIDNTGTHDTEMDDRTILAGDGNPPDPMSISAGKIVAELENSAVSMAASTAINVQVAVDASGNTASNSLTLTAPTLNFSNGANITTNNAGLTLSGNVVLADGATVALGTDSSAGNISITGTVNGTAGGGDESLSFDAGGGSIDITNNIGSAASLSSLTVTNSGGTTFGGTLNAGTVTLSNSTGTIAFQGNAAITTLTTAAQGYNVSFTGTTNVITNDTNFLNTGSVTLGDAAIDSITFVGGLDTTGGPSGTNAAGTVATSNMQMNLGAVTLTGATTFDTGTGIAAVLNLGVVTGSGNDLTIKTGTRLTLSQNITSAGAIVTLYPAIDGVSQTGGVLTAGSLLLKGAGSFALTRNNNFDTIAADVTGQLTYTDSDALTVGTIGATSGINSGGNDVTLNTGGKLGLSQSITAASATVTLHPLAGGVTQSGGAITTSNLLLEGGGTFTLNQSTNDTETLAVRINGSVSYRDATALTIGSVGAIQGILTGDSDADGVADVAGGDVDITAGAAITISKDIDTRTGTGGQHSSTGEIYQSGSTILLGQGNITITASGGDLPLVISSDLEITTGALFHIGDIIITARVYSTDDQPITLTSQNGSIDSTEGIIDSGGAELSLFAGTNLALGTVNAIGARLSLDAGDGVSTSSDGVITAKELVLTGTGSFQLNNWNNDFDTMAAAVNGAINLTDRSGLDIGVVGATSGISTSGGAVTILARHGPITVRQPIDTEPGSGGWSRVVGRVILSDRLRVGTGNVKLIAPEGGSVSFLGGLTYERIAIYDVVDRADLGRRLSEWDLAYSSLPLRGRWASARQHDRSNETIITLLNRYVEEMLMEKAGDSD